MKSETLRIRVTEMNETRVDLSFGAGAAAHLARLVPPPIKSRLAARSINLEAMGEQVRATDFAPGELLCVQDGPKTVRVWLE